MPYLIQSFSTNGSSSCLPRELLNAFILWGLLFCGYSLKAQDRIYLLNDAQLTGHIISVDKKILYSELGDPKAKKQKIPRKKVGFIRFNNGMIQVFSKNADHQLPFQVNPQDRLLLTSGKVIPVAIKGIYPDYFEYISLADPERRQVSSPKSGILAYIPLNKELITYVSTEELTKNLLVVEEEPFVAKAIPAPTPDHKPSSNSAGTEQAMEGEGGTQSATEEIEVVDTPMTSPVLTLDEEEFKRKALEKTRMLTQYIRLITDKKTSIFESNQAIEEAITLFISDSSFVEVSSVNRPTDIKTFFIRPYLEHIKLLKYDKVDIEWVDISYVGKVYKGPDGRYYGTVTFVQKFSGIKDNKVVYQDKTYKRVEVVLKTYEKNFMGRGTQQWDVFLSNIKVEHTTR